jgi:hypothetical protein
VITNLAVYPSFYVFVPSVFGEYIPTVEFGTILAKTACWGIERK